MREVAAEDEEERLRRRRGDVPEVGEDAADALDGDDADGDGVVFEQRVEGIKLLLEGVEVAEGEEGPAGTPRRRGSRTLRRTWGFAAERPPQDGLVPEREERRLRLGGWRGGDAGEAGALWRVGGVQLEGASTPRGLLLVGVREHLREGGGG